MALQTTIKQMKGLLSAVTADLDKAENGNKAASQRVRTGTVRLEKLAKLYRKESISAEKKGEAKKPAKKASKGKPAKKMAKGMVKKTMAKPKGLAVKRATAKLPMKRC